MEVTKRGRAEPKPAKVEQVKKLTEQLGRAKAIYLTDFTGLDVELITRLRREFYQEKAEYIVGKKTLTRLALKDAGYGDLTEKIEGAIGIAIGYDDPAAPARIIAKFAQETEKLPVHAGIFEGQRIGPKDMEAIRNLPTRPEALAMLVHVIGSPMQDFVGVLAGVVQNFLGVLEAIIEKKKAAGETG